MTPGETTLITTIRDNFYVTAGDTFIGYQTRYTPETEEKISYEIMDTEPLHEIGL